MSYFRWDTVSDAPFCLQLVNSDGTGLTGSFPTIGIKRIKEVSGSFLDGYYWNGSSSFISSPTFLTMSEVDSSNLPGLYTYCFSQSLIRSEHIYNVYYKHNTVPIGFDVEVHYFVNSLSGAINIYEQEPTESLMWESTPV